MNIVVLIRAVVIGRKCRIKARLFYLNQLMIVLDIVR